jgi:hypothetical protein
MKKMIFVLTALLLAAPVMANVTISCAQKGEACQGYAAVDISYAATEDSNLPRGFGLNVSVDSGVTVTGVEAGSANADYWVYPGSIVIDTNDPAHVDDYGSPVVGSLPASSVIIEMGSLHYPTEPNGPNSPDMNGLLITLELSGTDCNVTVSGNATRGKVVNYAADEADTVYGSSCYIAGPPCWTGVGAEWTAWDNVDRPCCWCSSIQPRQCHGDADGKALGKGNYWVSSEDLNVFVAALNKNYAQIQGQVYNHSGPPPYTTDLICADYDHRPQGKGLYRVGSDDLNIFVKWLNTANKPDPNCLDVTGNQDQLPQP